MRYPAEILEEIRTRLPVSDVVGRRVQLRKAGREWKGLSPFAAERTPSFFVNDQKQFYHCFSSGKHGSIFDFLIETEGLTFREAVERLAAEAGVALPRESAEGRAAEARRRSHHEVMDLAAHFYEEQLRGRAGARARDYLAGRALGDEVRVQFRLGYAPGDRYALRDHLAGRDVPAELMVELGLLVAGEDVAVPFDRFRDRVMFPIHDARGRVIAFGGRAMSKDVPAKYLNSPETPLFHKGEVLYNHHLARKAAHERGGVIAVEGYVDAIAMTLAGHPNVVAPLGTALTEAQLGLLWRMAEEPILCFDGDKAGRRAAYRAMDVAMPALEPGRSLRFALLPEGQDPDDLLRAGGAAAVDRVLQGDRPLVDMLWARETEGAALDTPERRAALAKRLRDAVAVVRDETLRRFYRDEIEARLRALLAPRRDGGGGAGRGGAGRPASGWNGGRTAPARPSAVSTSLAGNRSFSGATRALPREALILVVLARHPELLGRYQHELSELGFVAPLADRVARELLHAVADAAEEERELTRVETEGVAALAAEVQDSNRRYVEPPFGSAEAEPLLLQAMSLQGREVALRRELDAALVELAAEQRPEVEERVIVLQADLASLEGIEADQRGTAESDRPLDGFLDGVLREIGLGR